MATATQVNDDDLQGTTRSIRSLLEQLCFAQTRDSQFEPSSILLRLTALAETEELNSSKLSALLDTVLRERDDYVNDDDENGDDDELDSAIAEITASNEQIERQIDALKARNLQLGELGVGELAELERKVSDELDDGNDARIARHLDATVGLRTLTSQTQKKLQVFSRSDALNESFYISHEGEFGTINGLRLGTMPQEPVEWNEINAAFGFAAMLLDAISKQVGFDFFVWRVRPRGSESLMVNIQNSTQTLNLFCNANWLWKSSFNAGISAFADCVDEMADFARREDPSFFLPHRIGPSTVNAVSVHYSNSESWTRAMKYLLTDLKWLLTWAARRKNLSMVSEK